MPCLQHRAILGDAVLALARIFERIWVDVLQADEYAVDASAGSLLDKTADLVRHGVHLGDHVDLQAFFFAHFDQTIEYCLPGLVTRQIIVGDEELVHALGDVGANQPFDVVRAAGPGLTPLNFDDRAEAAEKGAPPSRIEARAHAHRPAHDAHREIRHRFTLQAREVVHEIVQRLELAVIRRAEEFLEPSLGLPGKQRDTEIHRFLQLGRDLWQHRQAAANMKAADGNWKSCGTERPGNVYRARKLIALHANQSDQPASARRADLPDNAVRPDTRVGFIPRRNPQLDVLAQDPPFSAVERKAVQRR